MNPCLFLSFPGFSDQILPPLPLVVFSSHSSARSQLPLCFSFRLTIHMCVFQCSIFFSSSTPLVFRFSSHRLRDIILPPQLLHIEMVPRILFLYLLNILNWPPWPVNRLHCSSSPCPPSPLLIISVQQLRSTTCFPTYCRSFLK